MMYGAARAQQPERRDKVDGEHPLKSIVAQLMKRRAQGVTRVVHDDV
jgi:hypothetical protein